MARILRSLLVLSLALALPIRVSSAEAPGYPGFSVEVQQDEFGRVTQETDANGTSTYAYDDLNRPVSASPAVGRGSTYQYVRDLVNTRWITRVTLSGVGTWQYGADGKGRGAEVLNPFGQLAVTRFDPDGKAVREERANGTYTLYGYTGRDWLSSVEHRLANGALLDRFDYLYTDGAGVYDPTGRLRREIDAGARTHEFLYNRHSELTGETHPDFGSASYLYDPNGNRTQKTKAGISEWYGYDGQNKLLWSNQAANAAPTPNQPSPYRLYQYDAAGQPTDLDHRDTAGGGVTQDQYRWDGMGKLRRLFCVGAQQERYRAEYDGGGNRGRMTLNGVTRTYSGGLHEDDSNGQTATYTPGVSERKGGVDWSYHQDWIGSTRYLTTGTGLTAPTAYRFDAYGVQSQQAGPDSTRFKFAGGHGYESDAPAGLQQLGARLYDPGVGRFISPDPIGFAGGLNLYGYCGGNPVGLVDPSGLVGGPFTETERAGLAATNRAAIDWVKKNPGSAVRGAFGLIDPGVADVMEVLGGREIFTGRALSPAERALTAVMIAVPVVPTNLARGLGGALARGGSRTACRAAAPFVQSAPSSRALARNLVAAGFSRPAGAAAHHIVAGTSRGAAEARRVLDKFAIDINSVDNGVFLAQTKASAAPGAYHPSVHTKAYYDEVNELLSRAKTRQQALDALASIRRGLLNKSFP